MLNALLIGLLLQVAPPIGRDELSRITPTPPNFDSRFSGGGFPDRYDRVDVRAVAQDRLLLDKTLKVTYNRVGARGDPAKLLDESCRRGIGDAGFKFVMSPVERDARRFRVAASYRPDASCASGAKTASIDQVVLLEAGKPVVLQGSDGLRLELKRR